MFQGKEYVYEVYKTRSFSKAAANLYISQPSLSATIKKIEQRIGSPIFDRSTNPIRLTECGQKYIQYIERIFDMENEFQKQMNNLSELRTGNLTIGGSNLFSSYILPPLLTAFMKKYPLIHINIIEANTKLLEKKLFAGDLDLVIDNYRFPETIYSHHHFCREHLLLAVPASFCSNSRLTDKQLSAEDIYNNKHLEASTSFVSLKEFREEPFILLRSGNDTRERSELLFKEAQIVPNVILELDQQVTAYHVACYGMGITIISDTLIKKVPADDRVVFYKLEEAIAARNIYFYRKSTKYVTRAMEEFLKLSCQDSNSIPPEKSTN
ncbi:MAG TPA: LysR family transcriptional regulator [Lachnospiraceae bacterium]|jgi:DNA-binding transcriptional LysR family regulator|nr:LysR family transcriptional regulator [Lachnospiraceae bacterium]